MLKLIKYELIGKYKSFGILILLIILLNLGLISRMNHWETELLVMLSIFIGMAIGVTLLVWCINLFAQDLYDDKGYLTYTLPQRGYSILGSKLIVSAIFYIIAMCIAAAFSIYFMNNINNFQMSLDMAGIKIKWLNIAILFLTSFVGVLMTIYFSISVTRLAIAKKRMGKFAAFIIFAIINTIEGLISYKIISKVFDQTFYVKIFGFLQNTNTINTSNIDGDFASLITKGIPLNTADVVFQIVIFIVFFIVTSYIIEKKIDL